MRGKNILTTVTVAVISSAITVFGISKYYSNQSYSGTEQTNSPYQLSNYSFPVAPSGMAPVDFTYAAALSTPAVVHVKTTYSKTTSYSEGNDVLRQFFGDDFFGNPYGNGGVQQASGSGVIVSDDGYIVTNYHVVKNADAIEVVLYDKQKAQATLVGTDPSTDIALIKIDMKNLPLMQYSNSDSVRVGEWVLAVGNPFDLTSTVTAGIISAKGRKIDILGENASTPIESFIQTDAAVNPGNSGGALVNTKGELIGINTAIATPTGTYAGYSFAVPVNIVKKVVKDLKKYGVVQRAYLGVEVDPTKDDIGGVYISNVVDNSGADAGGIKVGDILTHINNTPIHSFPELQEQLSAYGPGEKVNVSLIRDKDRKNLVVELKNKEGNTSIIEKSTNKVFESLGVELEDVSSKEAQYYDVDGGVRITGIRNGAISQQTRIHQDFIITAVDDVSIKNANEFAKTLENKAGKNVIIEGFYPSFPNKIYNYGLSIPNE
ncbi:MAG: trypsin-like peptidase domain-containing protein [Fimbriimonadaceae bacterium]|nr:trypsin-like peptidase domain-containing protein [Chitinophagales bacterium]